MNNLTAGTGIPYWYEWSVDLFAFGQYLIRQAAAALVWSKKLQPTVMVIVVIPLYKQADSFPCLFQCSKSFGLIIRTILQRFE